MVNMQSISERWIALVTFVGALCTVFLNGPGVIGQEANPQTEPQDCPIEQMVAMLHAIDPYNSHEELKGSIHVFGSTSMDGMVHSWAGGFRQFHADVGIEISGTGSEEAFKRLVQDPAGVAMLSRPVTPQELEELKKQGLKNPTSFIVGREALGVFVHPDNPVQTISGAQLRSVFTTASVEESPTWKMLGASGEWADLPIHVISRSSRSGTQRFLTDFVFSSSEMREGVSAHHSNAEVLQAVAGDRLAIAICGLRCNLTSVRALSLKAGDALVPSDDRAILTGQYPLMRPLTMVVDMGQDSADAVAAQEFVHFGLCRTGQSRLISAGFFPVDLPLLRAGLLKLGAEHVR